MEAGVEEAALAFAAVTAGLIAMASLEPALRLRLPRRHKPDRLKAKLAAGLAGAAPALIAGALLPGRIGLLAALAAPLACFFAPDVLVARRERARRVQVRRDLPALLDLLRVSVEAGASLPEALGEVGRRSNAPLAGEWAAVAAQVRVGVGLTEALEAHRAALPLPEIDALTAALGRAARHGAPLSDTLAAQARGARLARRRAVQEQAAKAGPKMQLVVALLLVPSVMLMVAAGLLSALLESGTGGIFGA
jgi:tight adherence protein C